MVNELQAAFPQFGSSLGVVGLRVGASVASAIEEPTAGLDEVGCGDKSVGGGHAIVKAVDVVADLS